MDQNLTFAARRSFKNIWIFMAVFGAFIPIGIAILLLSEDARVGIGFAGFGGFFVLVMLGVVLAPGSRCRLGPGGVFLKRGFSTREIAYADIQSIALLSENQVNAIVTEYMTPAMRSEVSFDIKGWYKANNKYGEFSRFCTVPIVQSKTSRGSALSVTSFGAKTSGEFELLRLTDGQEVLLSPTDVQQFHASLSHRAQVDQSLSEPYAFRTESGGLPAPQRQKRRKNVLIIQVVTAAVIVAGVALSLILRSPPVEHAAEQVAAAVVEAAPIPAIDEEPVGWIDDDTFRSFVSTPFLDTFIKDPEQRKEAARDLLYGSYHFSMIDDLVTDYYLRFDVYPDGDGRALVRANVETIFYSIKPVLVREEMDEEITEISAIIEIQKPGLHKSVEDVITETLESLDG